MPEDDFKDAALVLVGHGATLNPDSSAPTLQHADELLQRNIFAQVLPCFWKEEPYIYGALRGVFARRVFIVPIFISEGYFTEQVIPREMGFCRNDEPALERKQTRGDQTFHYCGPVGTHDSMTEVIVARAKDIVTRYPYPIAPKPADTTLFIAGHGTINNANSRKAIERQAELYKRALDEADKPFPDDLPGCREVFVANSREEAIEAAKPFLAAKYKVYHQWGQDEDMPDDDNDLSLDYDELLEDRFMLGSPEEIAEQVIAHNKRVGINHLILNFHWVGMPQALCLESMTRFAEEVRPLVDQGL